MHRIFEINAGKQIRKRFTDLVVFLACVCVCKEHCLRNDVTSARKKAIQFFQHAKTTWFKINCREMTEINPTSLTFRQKL